MNSNIRWYFGALVAIGVVLRIAAGIHSLGFVHPDEHQQYLEAANKIAYGYGVTFWEYERGIRHYLYPGLLAGTLLVLDLLSITAPIQQAQVIRTLMGLMVFGSLVWFSFVSWRDGKTSAALSLLAMTALSPYFLFVGARTLSETAVIPLLVVMLILLDRRPWIAGGLAGLMFAVRFQSALFVAPLFFAMLVQALRGENRWQSLIRSCVPFALGCTASLMFVGTIDYFTWGSWFHSPIEYFRANVIEHIAASFGTSPWYQYLIWTSDTVIDCSISMVPLALLGAWFKPRYAFALGAFVVAHSFIGHKEARFLWPVVPVALILIAEGIDAIARNVNASAKPMLALVSCLILLVAIHLQWANTDWHMGRSEATSLALAEVGKMEEVQGVALVGGDAFSGNYFYLRKNVPYIVDWEWEKIASDPRWKSGQVNYLIASEHPGCDHLEPISTIQNLSIYRVLTVN